jgi:hypothetical protein
MTGAMRAIANAFGGSETAAEPSTGAKDRPRREPPAVAAADSERALGAAPADAVPALAAAPATAAASPAVTTGPGEGADGPVPVPDGISAMLAAAIPGTSFVDPLGGINDGPPIPGGKTDTPQDADPSSANGSEAAI